jgi:hypothetical protein
MNDIKIVRYKTAKACLAAFHGCKVKELFSLGWWYLYDHSGKRRRISMKKAHQNIKSSGCWGWCSHSEQTIHLWISKKAKRMSAIRLIAHELGHCQTPHYHDGAEEVKATKYEDVAAMALEILENS